MVKLDDELGKLDELKDELDELKNELDELLSCRMSWVSWMS